MMLTGLELVSLLRRRGWLLAALHAAMVMFMAGLSTLHGASAPENLAPLLKPLLEHHKTPALAAAVVRGTNLVATGAVGVRRLGGATPVTVHDKFHYGSITKSMTATLAAIMVQEGKVKWQTTLADVFPELRGGMHTNWHGVTLEQLLTNRGGAPNTLDAGGLWSRLWKFEGEPRAHREYLLRELTIHPPEAAPGTRYIYSNAGFSLAGAMLEQLANRSWEELATERLFRPLGMTSVGYGAPASVGKEDQPWGHKWDKETPKPVPPGHNADNPPAISPAGRAHGSIIDLARYAAGHLAGARGESRLLPAAAFEKLHTPVSGQDYAFGWAVAKRGWAGGTALNHTGSNTMFYAVVWIAPAKDFAVVVATNAGGDRAFKACDETVGKLIQEYLR